jgi:putative Holliday junction resolvase
MTDSKPSAFTTLPEFATQLPAKGRLIGLDVGTVTIGVAVSDERRTIASPDHTIARTKWADDAKALTTVIDGRNVCGCVIGYPVNMDGTLGPRAQATRAFARNFAAKFFMPVLLWDERLSTAAVTRMMIEGDLSRARRDALVDKLAASYILQGVLDGLASQNPTSA